MTKRILEDTEYTFDASAKTITFTEVIPLNFILLVTNIATNDIIYNFACDGYGGTLSGLVLTLEYDTTAMIDTDALNVIIYEENKLTETNKTLALIEKQTEVLDECLIELKSCNKYLRKIYNPE